MTTYLKPYAAVAGVRRDSCAFLLLQRHYFPSVIRKCSGIYYTAGILEATHHRLEVHALVSPGSESQEKMNLLGAFPVHQRIPSKREKWALGNVRERLSTLMGTHSGSKEYVWGK